MRLIGKYVDVRDDDTRCGDDQVATLPLNPIYIPLLVVYIKLFRESETEKDMQYIIELLRTTPL